MLNKMRFSISKQTIKKNGDEFATISDVDKFGIFHFHSKGHYGGWLQFPVTFDFEFEADNYSHYFLNGVHYYRISLYSKDAFFQIANQLAENIESWTLPDPLINASFFEQTPVFQMFEKTFATLKSLEHETTELLNNAQTELELSKGLKDQCKKITEKLSEIKKNCVISNFMGIPNNFMVKIKKCEQDAIDIEKKFDFNNIIRMITKRNFSTFESVYLKIEQECVIKTEEFVFPGLSHINLESIQKELTRIKEYQNLQQNFNTRIDTEKSKIDNYMKFLNQLEFLTCESVEFYDGRSYDRPSEYSQYSERLGKYYKIITVFTEYALPFHELMKRYDKIKNVMETAITKLKEICDGLIEDLRLKLKILDQLNKLSPGIQTQLTRLKELLKMNEKLEELIIHLISDLPELGDYDTISQVFTLKIGIDKIQILKLSQSIQKLMET